MGKASAFTTFLELYFHFCVGFLMFSFLLLVFIRPTHWRAISGEKKAESGENEFE